MKNPVHQAIVDAILAGQGVESAFFEVRSSLEGDNFIVVPGQRRSDRTEKLEWIVRDLGSTLRGAFPKDSPANRWILANVPDPKCIASKLAGIAHPTREQIEDAFSACVD
jgi:hypothetical protein